MFNTNISIKSIILYIFIFIIIEQIYSQIYIPADPYDLLFIEKKLLTNTKNPTTLITRPFFRPFDKNNNWSLRARSEFFYNSSAPNLENMSDRWVGKGIGFFSSINFAYRNRYIVFSAEPYYFINQNDDYDEPNRVPKFSILNDNRPHLESPYVSYGIRELQIYANYNGFGTGFSNANMWWGPGLHTSTSMTNNTSGFGHYFLGTLGEKRYKNWGFSGRYVFSKLDNKSKYKPYHTAALLGISYYSNPKISIGIVREALTGGTHKNVLRDSVRWQDAALSIFKGIFIPEDKQQYTSDWSYDDHAGSAYISVFFSRSKLNIFFEIARTDLSSNSWSLLVYPDHAFATNVGFRKYGLFGNEKLFFSCEYFQNINSRSSHRIQSGDWYARKEFDFSSYNGRRWVAHSGSDSDDFLLMFGWLDGNFTILPSFNYERHGVRYLDGDSFNWNQQNNNLPETKLEFRLDLRYKYKVYNINLYFEREITLNLKFDNKTRKGNVIWIGIERDIDKLFKKNKS